VDGALRPAICSVAAVIVPVPTPPTSPTLNDTNLAVRNYLTGLTTPIGLAYIRPNDTASPFFVIEKNTGQVIYFPNDDANSTSDIKSNRTVLDLNVNFASERGLLGIAVHPDFPASPWVYLYWCESTTGNDTSDLTAVPLLGNRIDRFTWDGTTMTQNINLIKARTLQIDEGQPPRGNHDGGPLRFGLDKKLYVIMGDRGRRGQLQNLVNGPTGIPFTTDDQYGGPEPDDAHLTGCVLRFNDDGSIPSDNPFYDYGAMRGGEAGANIQKVFYYGVRNSFGLAFDPQTGNLWESEPGDDSYDEVNMIVPGGNGGWIQFMGPQDRIADWKALELLLPPSNNLTGGQLQQIRYPATNISSTPAQAQALLNVFPGSVYNDPKFSWRYAVSPAAIGFLTSSALGTQYEGNLFVGASTSTTGFLLRFALTSDRRDIVSPSLAHLDFLDDRVADNNEKDSLEESESLIFGLGFGIGVDIQTSPRGTLLVVSISDGNIYEIYPKT